MSGSNPTFFEEAQAFRNWLAAHHDSEAELLVGFWKKSSGKASIDWPQARDEALCFGWIDGLRKSRDEESYTIRFTPRRPGSVWSRVNLERIDALRAQGRMTEAGERACADPRARTQVYSYERPHASLSQEEEARFRASAAAWTDFQRRPPSYRRVALHWVTSAKRPETRARRLDTLIRDSEAGRRIAVVDISRKA